MKVSRMLTSCLPVSHDCLASTIPAAHSIVFPRTSSSSSSSSPSSAFNTSVQHFRVPPLSQTLDKFLHTVKPLLAADQYLHACQLVEQFGKKGAYGEQLQALLETKAKNCVNWLEDWWLNVAYLEYRSPVAIHVNPGILSPQLPFHGKDGQLRYAANLIFRLLEYKKLIDSGNVPVDKLRGQDLCMQQYYHIFGCCRVPGDQRDSVTSHPGGRQDSPRHIIVIHNGHIFALDVYNSNGQPLAPSEIYNHLVGITDLSTEPASVPIGILTSEHRDKWSKVFSRLSEDSENRRHLQDIQSSIFVLALDKSTESTSGNTDSDTVHLNEMSHGGGSRVNSCNRWFDKVLQAIVSPDGYIGFNYEHSAAEGPPIVHLADACYTNLTRRQHPSSNLHELSVGTESNLPSVIDDTGNRFLPNGKLAPESSSIDKSIVPRKLTFKMMNDVQEAINDASASFDALVKDLDLIFYSFRQFGKSALKTHRVSPDAFIQIALQFTYYRMYGLSVPTYESGSLRRFHHGRTDTIRSCSQESVAFCRVAVDEHVPTSEKTRLLRLAISAHSKYTEKVTKGQGIDRHLLGLKLIALEHGLPVPELFNDPVYLDTCYWKISTSQVASRTGSLLCFAPVVPDGYGICYNPMDSELIFAISSWNSCRSTSARQFADALEQSLTDSLNFLSADQTKSKL